MEHASDISAMSWSPNGAFLVTATINNSLCLWDTKTQKSIKVYVMHPELRVKY